MPVLMYKQTNLSGSGKAVASQFDEQDADKKVASAALVNSLKQTTTELATTTEALGTATEGLRTDVDNIVEEITDMTSTTVFNADGSITKTYTDGSKEITTFNDDGSITLEIYDKDNVKVKTIVTTFNDDGSITEEVSQS